VDLTGKVKKIDPHSFFHSREADFFKGQWIRDDGETVVVSVAFTCLRGNLTVSCVLCLGCYQGGSTNRVDFRISGAASKGSFFISDVASTQPVSGSKRASPRGKDLDQLDASQCCPILRHLL
jgi:hypothetical protein